MTVKFQPTQFIATHGAKEVIDKAMPDRGGFIQNLIKRHNRGGSQRLHHPAPERILI